MEASGSFMMMTLFRSHPVGFAVLMGVSFVFLVSSIYHVGNGNAISLETLKNLSVGLKKYSFQPPPFPHRAELRLLNRERN